MPATIYLSLGANLGNRQENLAAALRMLSSPEIQIIKTSALYETEPQDIADQPWFLNQVAECNTALTPQALLVRIHAVEADLGRIRAGSPPRGPRLIDIDILLFDGEIVNTTELQIPHPRMLQRRFVLEPLLELRPDLVDPRDGAPLRSALAATADQKVQKLSPR